MVLKSGELMTEKIKQEKIPVVPVLKNLITANLIPDSKKFSIHPKAQADLSQIAGNALLNMEAGKSEVNRRPLKVGVLFSGGPASGGHNVVVGLYDAVKEMNPASEIVGFANGPDGLLKGEARILTAADIDGVRNQGGFFLLGTSRTKFEKVEDLEKCRASVEKFALDGLLIIGGDDSNTNAAHLGNFLRAKNSPTVVVGIPKTIDGDLAYLPYLQASFGFHTASRIYSEMVGNINRDLPSSRKIWHFVKLMGRSASWITLEVALQTQPNVALIGEEIMEKKMTLAQVVEGICRVIARRSLAGKKYGIVLIPEGIVEFIPEIKELISEINTAIVKIGNDTFIKLHLSERKDKILVELSQEKEKLFISLPPEVQSGLLSGLDPHGNVQVSQIASDVLLMDLCREKLAKEGIVVDGQTHKVKMTTQTHFYGYDGRCGYPTWFDAAYAYNLGRVASILVSQKNTGYMAVVTNLAADLENWQALALPLAGMMSVEARKGKEVLVISKYLVNLNSPAFKEFEKNRDRWAINDDYLCPGPIQYWGPEELVKSKAVTLLLNSGK